MSKKGQTSFEFLFVLAVVVVLVIIIFASYPKENVEIVALGITKSNLDTYLMQNNYSGKYNLESNINDSNIDINIIFIPGIDLGNYEEVLENKIKQNLNFEYVNINVLGD